MLLPIALFYSFLWLSNIPLYMYHIFCIQSAGDEHLWVFFFLGPHLRQMEVPRLGVESELQLLAYITATATPDLSFIWDLHCSLQQHQSLTHRARPGIEPVSSWTLCWILNLLSHSENSHGFLRKVVSYLYNLHTSRHVCGQNGHGDAAIGKNLPLSLCLCVCS